MNILYIVMCPKQDTNQSLLSKSPVLNPLSYNSWLQKWSTEMMVLGEH